MSRRAWSILLAALALIALACKTPTPEEPGPPGEPPPPPVDGLPSSMIALGDSSVAQKLEAYKKKLADGVEQKSRKLQEARKK